MLAKLLAWVRLIISARTAGPQYSSGADRQDDARDYLAAAPDRLAALRPTQAPMPDPDGTPPPCNRALDDLLASAADEETRQAMLTGMVLIAAEMLASEGGRAAACRAVGAAAILVRFGQPVRPWPP